MAARTRSRVAVAVFPESLTTRETVAAETPACSATSLMVVGLRREGGMMNRRVEREEAVLRVPRRALVMVVEGAGAEGYAADRGPSRGFLPQRRQR